MGPIILGVVAGIAAVLAVVAAIELGAQALLDAPSDAQPMPLSVQLVILAAYFLAALAGGFVAARISRAAWTAWLLAALVSAGAVGSMFLIPYPQWMQVAAVIAPLLGGAAAHHAHAPRRAESGRDA